MKLGPALLAVAVLLSTPGAWAEGEDTDASAQKEKPSKVRWNLELEGGSEFDTNIHRLELGEEAMDEVVASPLMRGGARLRLSYKPKKGQQLRMTGFGGAKLFTTEDGQSENVAIVSLTGHYGRALRSRSMVLGVRGNYYDAFGYEPFGAGGLVNEGRNFSLGNIEATATVVGPRQHRLTMHAGYQSFTYKPDEDFDWSGDHYGLQYQTTFWRGDPDEDLDAASVDVSVGYRLSRRGYRGRAFTNVCGADEMPEPRCFLPTDFDRADMHHAAGAELVYTGDRIYSARYEVQISDSNSYGQSLVRQRFEVGLTTETWAEIFLTARAAVQFNTFLDPLLLARNVQAQTFVTIDDENRNSLSLHLARDVGKDWSVEARYALFTNEFATQELSFRRQVFYLGAVYTYD